MAWIGRCESWSDGVLWQLRTSTHYRAWMLRIFFIYWYNFVAEDFERLRTLSDVKKLDSVAFFDCCEIGFFYFVVKLYPLLYLECSEIRLIWIFLLLRNLKSGMLLLPEAEHQHPLNAAKLDQLEYFEGCKTRVIGILRLLWCLAHSYNSFPMKPEESNLEIAHL